MRPTLQTKDKSKRNERFGKVLIGNTNSVNRPDLSSLRKPIVTSVSNLYQVCELLDDGTDEVKSILSHECNVIYECRVCHSLFRSIGNFVSHKREYCTDKFDVTLHRCVLNNYNTNPARESVYMNKAEETSNDGIKNDRILRSQVSKTTNKKDLTAIIDMISKRREEYKEKIIHLYNTKKTSNDGIKNNTIFKNQVPKKTNRKNPITITHILNKSPEEYIKEQIENEVFNVPNNQCIYLEEEEAVDTNCSAVYQTVESSDVVVDSIDLMKDQVIKLQDVTNLNALAVKEQTSAIQSKNQFKNQLENQLDNQLEDQLKNQLENQLENKLEKSDSPIQANMSDQEKKLIYQLPINNLSCSKCNAKFSTKKTLAVHMKTLHIFKRLCYPCPCCTSIFANTWSVYRHLYKAHKKSIEQVRKLKLQIQESAFHRRIMTMNGVKEIRAPRASILKNVIKNSSKTQKLIKHIESNKKLYDRYRKKLNRKTSLPYLQYQMPNSACDETTIRIKQRNTKLPFSISDDIQCKTKNVDLLSNTITKSSIDTDISNKNSKQALMSSENNHKKSIIQDVFNLNEEKWNMQRHEYNISKSNSVDNNDFNITSSENIDDSKLLSYSENEDNSVSHKKVKLLGEVCIDTTKVDFVTSRIKNKKDKMSNHLNKRKKIKTMDLKETEKVKVQMDYSESQSACSIPPSEKNHTLLMENKIAAISDFRQMRCLLCRRKFTSVSNLRRHTALHIGWNRYRCKLCDFKSFEKCVCVIHGNKVHNIHDRKGLAELIFEIPQNEYTYDKKVDANVTDPKTESNNPDIIKDATTSLTTRVDFNDSNNLNTCAILQSKSTSTINEQMTESYENAKDLPVDKSYKKLNVQDLPEFLKLYEEASSFNVKQMLMEVILGSTDTSEVETHSNKSVIESLDASGHVNTKDNVNNVVTSDESKETFCPMLNNVKHQRPSRNRMKPLSKDFVYDLKKMTSRRGNAFINDLENLHTQKKAS